MTRTLLLIAAILGAVLLAPVFLAIVIVVAGVLLPAIVVRKEEAAPVHVPLAPALSLAGLRAPPRRN